jgi:hypothetical protein
MELIRELLVCLQYPHAEAVDLGVKKNLLTLICWLEDRKIRQLEVSERANLRTDNDTWDTAFGNYLESLGCPFSWENDSLLDCISWLVSHALAVEYEDIAETVQDMETDMHNEMRLDDAEDCASTEEQTELGNKINELGELVGLNRSVGEADPDYLQRISRTVRLFFSKESQQNPAIGTKQAAGRDSLESFPLGFDCGGKC